MGNIKYNLIGISGHKNSGKDLVANMIQYLTSSYYPKMEFLQYLKENKQSVTDSSFCIKRFADKLKDIVCILLGCTREQLEDRDFKEKELPEEWWCWKVYLDTKYYYHDYELVPFTGKLDVYKQLHESPENFFWHELVKLTPRLLLQLLGTDCGRNIIHPNIWCMATFNDYKGDVEEWKDIEGYENSYQVSSFGNVRSLDRTVIYGDKKGQYHTIQGKLLKPTLSDGYETVGLSGKTFTVHRLVAKAFIPNFSEDLVINHIDGNKSNNFYKNLECITQSENIKKSIKTTNGNIGVHQKDSKLNDEMVIEIRKHLLEKKLNQREIADLYNVSPSTISEIKTGRKWKHVGDETVITPSPIVPTKYPNWIIPDVRFPNEVEAIKKRGGIVIRVNRSGFEDNDIHPSEIALDNYQYFDYIINNDSDIPALLEKVKEFLYDGQDIKSNSK